MVPCAAWPLARLERLPKWLICIPLGLQWAALGLRYRSFMLPSAANPRITTGGLVGESKQEYWQDAGEVARQFLVPSLTLVHHHPQASYAAELQRAGLEFPLILKPSLGLSGYGVRKVDGLAALGDYLRTFPVGQSVVVQPFLDWAGEAGLFYWRRPGEAKGELAGIALRYYPQVMGDGQHSVAELMARSPRLRRLGHRGHHSALELERVPAAGEVVRLAHIGSTRVGGLYCQGEAHRTVALEQQVEAILQDVPEFYFGRLDVKFQTLADLEAGRFRVIELNGAGSEAIQAWDPRMGWREAFATIFRKQAMGFAIGDLNRKRGYPPASLWTVARLNWMQNRLIDRYPPSN